MKNPEALMSAGFISETAIEYRASQIVHDYVSGGALRAGDRMPEVDLAIRVAAGSGRAGLQEDWTEPEHLVVLVDVTDGEKEEVAKRLPRLRTKATQTEALGFEGRRLFGAKRKIFVVRPDGYIGFRGRASKISELETVCETRWHWGRNKRKARRGTLARRSAAVSC